MSSYPEYIKSQVSSVEAALTRIEVEVTGMREVIKNLDDAPEDLVESGLDHLDQIRAGAQDATERIFELVGAHNGAAYAAELFREKQAKADTKT